MAPHPPQVSERPGGAVALLDIAPPHPPRRSERPGGAVALLDIAPRHPPQVLGAPRRSRGTPRLAPPTPPRCSERPGGVVALLDIADPYRYSSSSAGFPLNGLLSLVRALDVDE